MAKINFKCSMCGNESWFKVNEETYVVTVLDLICDDCNPVEDETEVVDITDDEYCLGALIDGIHDYWEVYDLATDTGRLGFAEELMSVLKEFYFNNFKKKYEDIITELEERIEELESESSEDCYCETSRTMMEDRD